MTTPPVRRRRNISGAVWAALFALGATYETWALASKHLPDTLSDNTRVLFHTNTRVGRGIWLGAWGGFAAWFATHIARPNPKQ